MSDTSINKVIADYEKTAWYLKNAPDQGFNIAIQQLIKARVSMISLMADAVVEIDNHRRKYHPNFFQDNPGFDRVIGKVLENDRIVQYFSVNHNGLCALEILPGLYGTNFSGGIMLSLRDEKDKLIGVKLIEKVEDNELIKFDFLPIIDSANRELSFEIYVVELDKNSELSFYKSDKAVGRFLRNDKEIEGSLTYRLIYL